MLGLSKHFILLVTLLLVSALTAPCCEVFPTLNVKSAVYVKPYWRLEYIANGSGTLILVTRHPKIYFDEPVVDFNITVIIGVFRRLYYGRFKISNGMITGGNISWTIIPFFIERGAPKTIRVFNSNVVFERAGFRSFKLKHYILNAVVYVHGNVKLVYDYVSGILLEGLIPFRGFKVYVKLYDTNLRWYDSIVGKILPSYDSIVQVVSEVGNVSGVRVKVIGESILGNKIYAVEIGPINASRIILLDAGIHGSEVITVACALYVIERVVYEYAHNSSFRSMLEKHGIMISIVPCVNPDGLSFCLVEPPEVYFLGLTRKNARYVDLNRNFDYMWSYCGDIHVESPAYRGPEPFSEPESSSLARYILSLRNLSVYIDLHSGIQCVAIPYDKSARGRVNRGLVRVVSRVYGFNDILEGFLYGEAVSWVYFNHPNSPLALIVEVYGGSRDYWFEMYNPVDEGIIREICEDTYKALMVTINYIVGLGGRGLVKTHLTSKPSIFLRYLTPTIILIAVIVIAIYVYRRLHHKGKIGGVL